MLLRLMTESSPTHRVEGWRLIASRRNGGKKRATLPRKKKNIVHIGTWNVRTMRGLGKLHLLIEELDNIGMDLIGLCESIWDGEGHFQHGKHTIIYCGSSTARNGVAFIVSGKLKNSIISYRADNQRENQHKNSSNNICADICPDFYALRGRNRWFLRSTAKFTRTNSTQGRSSHIGRFQCKSRRMCRQGTWNWSIWTTDSQC